MYNRNRNNRGENRVIRFKCTLQNTIADVLRSRGWQEVKEESGRTSPITLAGLILIL